MKNEKKPLEQRSYSFEVRAEELEEQLQKGYVQAAREAQTCCHSRRQARSRLLPLLKKSDNNCIVINSIMKLKS